MKILISFFLSLFLYSFLLLGFYYFITQKKNKTVQQIVYIHKVVKINKKKFQQIQKKTTPKQIIKHKIKKSIPKKSQKTKSSFSNGGQNIKLDDIFSTVNDNIPTTKIKHKKQENMTKKTGKSNLEKVQQQLSKLQTTSTISAIRGSKTDSDYIQQQFAKIWNTIDTNVGDFVSLQVKITNGVLNIMVLATNLDTIRLNQFLTNLKSINTSKINNFKAIIDFKSKLKD